MAYLNKAGDLVVTVSPSYRETLQDGLDDPVELLNMASVWFIEGETLRTGPGLTASVVCHLRAALDPTGASEIWLVEQDAPRIRPPAVFRLPDPEVCDFMRELAIKGQVVFSRVVVERA